MSKDNQHIPTLRFKEQSLNPLVSNFKHTWNKWKHCKSQITKGNSQQQIEDIKKTQLKILELKSTITKIKKLIAKAQKQKEGDEENNWDWTREISQTTEQKKNWKEKWTEPHRPIELKIKI